MTTRATSAGVNNVLCMCEEYNLNKTRTLTTIYSGGGGLSPFSLSISGVLPRLVVELCINGTACSWHILSAVTKRERVQKELEHADLNSSLCGVDLPQPRCRIKGVAEATDENTRERENKRVVYISSNFSRRLSRNCACFLRAFIIYKLAAASRNLRINLKKGPCANARAGCISQVKLISRRRLRTGKKTTRAIPAACFGGFAFRSLSANALRQRAAK